MSRDFNGTSDGLSASATPITAYPWSATVWFNADTLATNNKDLFGLHDDPSVGTAVRLVIRADSSPAWRVGLMLFDGSYKEVFTTSAMSTGTWTNITVVANSSTSYSIFHNGADKQTGTTSAPLTFSNLDRLQLGRNSFAASDYFDGKLAHVAFWNNTALSDSQVTELQTKGPLLVGAPTAYWALTSNSSPEPDTGSGAAISLTVSTPTFSTDNPTLTLSNASYIMMKGM